MSRNVKIILGIVAGLLVLCMCSAVVGAGLFMTNRRMIARPLVAETVRVAQLSLPSSRPLNYQIPAGWSQQFSFDVFGFQMAGLGGSDGHSHIFVMQMPAGNYNYEADVQQALDRGNFGNYTSYRNGIAFHKVGEAQVTIRGQQVTMTVSEGTNHAREPYRQMMGAYKGDDGQTLIVIEQPVETWDQGVVDGFMASIN